MAQVCRRSTGPALHPGGLLGRGALVLDPLTVPLRQPDEQPEAAVVVAARSPFGTPSTTPSDPPEPRQNNRRAP